MRGLTEPFQKTREQIKYHNPICFRFHWYSHLPQSEQNFVLHAEGGRCLSLAEVEAKAVTQSHHCRLGQTEELLEHVVGQIESIFAIAKHPLPVNGMHRFLQNDHRDMLHGGTHLAVSYSQLHNLRQGLQLLWSGCRMYRTHNFTTCDRVYNCSGAVAGWVAA